MAWARIDDRFHDHPKAVGLDLAAVGLWTFCLTWAHSNRAGKLQGHIPADLPRRFGASPELAAQLVAAELWHEPGHTCTCPAIETGWLFHDYVDYLPEGTRQSRSEAGKRGAAARWAKKSQDAMASCHEVDSKPIANPMAKDDSRAHARRVRGYVGSNSEGSSTAKVAEGVQDRTKENKQGELLPPAPLTLAQRSKKITDTYAKAEPMCKWPAVNGIVTLALKKTEYSDEEIQAALLRMAQEGRGVTVESLRVELAGLAPRAGATNGKVTSTTATRAQAAIDAGRRVQQMMDRRELER